MRGSLKIVVGFTAALTGFTALTACGGGGSDDTSRDSLRVVNDSAPAKGKLDKVVWGLPFGEPNSLDPVKSTDASSSAVLINLCDTLLTRDADLKIKPGLATRWTWIDDTHLKLTLRDDARFWNGKPVTPDDVAYSLRRTADPKSGSANLLYFSRMRDAKPTGAHEVTVTFAKPDGLFLDALAGIPGAVVERRAAEKAGQQFGSAKAGMMCSGPYKIDTWEPGESIQISSTGSWWGTAPKVSKVEFRFITDPSTLTAALTSGQLDGAMNLTAGAVPALRRAKSGTLYAAPSHVILTIIPFGDHGLASDAKVRQAIDLAIDKKTFVKSVMNGSGQLVRAATTPAYWSGNPAAAVYDKAYNELAKPAFDLTKAKSLIASAGASGKSVNVAVIAGDQVSQQLATVMQDAGKKIGLTMKVRQVQPGEFFGMFFDPSKRAGFDFAVTPDAPAIAAPNAFLPTYALPQPAGYYNFVGYDDPEVTNALDASRSSLDPTKSAEEFVKAQAIVEAARLRINVAGMYQMTFLNRRLTGIPISLATIASPWAAELGAP